MYRHNQSQNALQHDGILQIRSEEAYCRLCRARLRHVSTALLSEHLIKWTQLPLKNVKKKRGSKKKKTPIVTNIHNMEQASCSI